MMSAKWLLLMVCPVLVASPAFGQSPYHHRNQGMTIGALMGALTGAAIGENNNKPLAGAAIGTAVGALTGAAIGDSVDTNIARQQAYQHRQMQQYYVSQAVSVDQVINLSRAGVSDSVIITQIHTHGIVQRLQPNDLIVMKHAGVSDVVIQSMQTARLASVPVQAPTPVYHDRVIVQEHYYVAPPPVYRVYPSYYHPHPRYYRPGTTVHWGVTVGR
jgi:uncharacterized membrane protein